MGELTDSESVILDEDSNKSNNQSATSRAYDEQQDIRNMCEGQAQQINEESH
jgi:hypothetical protein